MEQKILGRVVGERIYDGTGITGTSTTATVFSDSGVQKALPGDKYINTDTGNVYKCVVGGAASSATWVWIMCIKSNQWNLIDSLTSDSAADALTARMGKKLKGMIDDINFGSTQINCDNEENVTSIEMTIENADTVLTITDSDGNIGTYSYEASGLSDTTTLTFSTTDCGLSGAVVVKKVESSEAVISELSLLVGTDVVYEADLGIWENINNAADNVSVGATITDNGTNYKTGIVSKLINGVRKTLYPITHAMAVWYEAGVSTIKDKFDALDEEIETLNENLTDGSVTKVGTDTVGSIYKHIYLKNGTPTASNATIGDGMTLLQMEAGELKTSSESVGASSIPIYLMSGKIMQSGSTIGGAAQPMYMDSGSLKACNASVGSTKRPVYMSKGKILPLSETVGNVGTPVYLYDGEITKCGFTVRSGSIMLFVKKIDEHFVRGYEHVAFEYEFPKKPMVVANVADTAAHGTFSVIPQDISLNGFTACVTGYMSSAATTYVKVNYIAIGEI